jgi:hypothetical protein
MRRSSLQSRLKINKKTTKNLILPKTPRTEITRGSPTTPPKKVPTHHAAIVETTVMGFHPKP